MKIEGPLGLYYLNTLKRYIQESQTVGREIDGQYTPEPVIVPPWFIKRWESEFNKGEDKDLFYRKMWKRCQKEFSVIITASNKYYDKMYNLKNERY